MTQFLMLSLLLVIHFVNSEVIFYSNHVITPSRPEFLMIPKFGKNDAPHWAPGHGKSYIDISRLSMSTSCGSSSFLSSASSSTDCSPVTLELLMFEEPTDKAWMDYWPDREFCCTDELVISGYCANAGRLIIPSDLPNAYMRSLTIKPDVPVAMWEDDKAVTHHEIQETGLYILFMAECNPSSTPITVNGKIESLDPYGYLPADLYQNLPFYGALSCMYSIVGVAWLLLCACYR